MITFGHFEQDNSTSNGQEPIEWMVLDVQNNKALLLSRYGLDSRQYNTRQVGITWENCSLREWLNGDFLNQAFTAKEQKAILTTNVDNSGSQHLAKYINGSHSIRGGNDTKDKVFLLSYHEAFDVYFTDNESRRLMPTEYAIAQGAKRDPETGYYSWWLRSPGYYQYHALLINGYGYRHTLDVGLNGYVVRPALWLDLQSDIF